MTIRKPIEQMSEEEMRALLLKEREESRLRGIEYRTQKASNGWKRYTAYIPEGAEAAVREVVAEAVRRYQASVSSAPGDATS